MRFKLLPLDEALGCEPNTECSVVLKVIEVGATVTYKNQQGQERSYFVMKCADEKMVTKMRNYQVRQKVTIDAGTTYAFMNLLRKVGDEPFWTAKNTNILPLVQLDVPESVMTQTATVSSPVNSPRKLSDALQSPSTSTIKGKIVQTSPKDYRRQGELAIKFVALKDQKDEPAVKVALFGAEAENDYQVGDVISITDTYCYNKGNSLSTKQSSKLEFHPSDSIPFEISDTDYLQDDDFTKQNAAPVTSNFKFMSIISATLYECCPNPGKSDQHLFCLEALRCRNKKIVDNLCSRCKSTNLTKKSYYCTADIVVLRGTSEVSRHTIFYPELKKLVDNLPSLETFKTGAELVAFVAGQTPKNCQGTFTNGNLRVVATKRSLPDLD